MTTDLHQFVIIHLQDAYAMEQTVLTMLDNMIVATDDPQLKALLQRHRGETLQQGDRLKQRLIQLGHHTSTTKNAGAHIGGVLKGFFDSMRSEKSCKNLRDAFVTEHLEIAGYALLERFASRAADPETAAIARQNREEEVEMANRLNDYWDRVVDHDLMKMNIEKDNTGAKTGAYGIHSDAAERRETWTGSSADADMGIGLHSNHAVPETNADPLEANIPQSANFDTRPATPITSKPFSTRNP